MTSSLASHLTTHVAADERETFLFVYGTLRPSANSPWSNWLCQFTDLLSEATVPGKLYLVDSHRDFKYPALVKCDKDAGASTSSRVIGDVLKVKPGVIALKSTGPGRGSLLEELDKYETSEYERGSVTATTLSGQDVECCVYWWVANIDRLALIPGGDFLRR